MVLAGAFALRAWLTKGRAKCTFSQQSISSSKFVIACTGHVPQVMKKNVIHPRSCTGCAEAESMGEYQESTLLTNYNLRVIIGVAAKGLDALAMTL